MNDFEIEQEVGHFGLPNSRSQVIVIGDSQTYYMCECTLWKQKKKNGEMKE